jgi:probable phosphoglycerate mutase
MIVNADREIVLVRHGETLWSKAGRHTGRTDVPLTDEGRSQAACVGRALARLIFDRVYASPLSRARETCVLAGLGAQMVSRKELVERDYGGVDGLTTAEMRARIPGWSVWTTPLPGGESAEAVGDRCDLIIAELRAAGGRSALFGHGHCLRVLAARWLDLPALDGRLFELTAAAICLLGYEHDQAVIRLWNSTQHLFA